ncbi:hypothetical protein BJY04DRAFT_213938 [Aspergillus karnatakaensis]|uniref:uncharacterized protein n=1 Tax=Aspergillus karnatakaensis TaxID=1810916 RepID=UPI003CCD31C1
MSLNTARPTLHRSLTAPGRNQSRPFSIAIPARLANDSYRSPKPLGYLAEKGRFPFRERAPSYESVRLQSSGVEGVKGGNAEVEMLREKTVEQRRKIEALQRTVSELVAGEKGRT